MLTDTITFAVDFNDRDSEGRLIASMRFASGPRYPEIDERVFVADDEGNSCEGIVVGVEGLIVYIDLDRSTWRRDLVSLENPFGVMMQDGAETSGRVFELEGCEGWQSVSREAAAEIDDPEKPWAR